MESRATLSGRVRAEVPGLLGLALPIVVGMAASTLIGVTDSLMVAPLGAVPLAAVGVTGSVLLIIVAAIFGLCRRWQYGSVRPLGRGRDGGSP
jgi:multidrug resistance protein, MATE family